jgi:dihydrodipicolinate synthase/N-acetylneuraminate lyase
LYLAPSRAMALRLLPGAVPARAFVVGPVPTPFHEDESVDHAALAEQIDGWCTQADGLSGFVLGTYGGEEFHLGEPDKRAIVETAVSANKGRRAIICGIDTLSSTEAIRLCHVYASAGADAVRVRIPARSSWSGSSTGSDALQNYFAAVTQASPVPVIVIHQPKPPTGAPDATPAEIARVCSLPNVHAYIMGLEYRTESLAAALLPASCELWGCNGSLCAASGLLGATGACCFFAMWSPPIIRRIVELAMEGKHELAQAVQAKIFAADYLGMTWGTPCLKAGLGLLGYRSMRPRCVRIPPFADTHCSYGSYDRSTSTANLLVMPGLFQQRHSFGGSRLPQAPIVGDELAELHVAMREGGVLDSLAPAL